MNKLIKNIYIALAAFFIGNASAITGAYETRWVTIPLPPGEWRLLSDKPNPDHNWYGHQIRAGRALVLGRPEGDNNNIAGILIRHHNSTVRDTFQFPDPSCYTNVELGLSNFYETASSNIWNKCSGLWWLGKAYSPMDFLRRVKEAQYRRKNPLPSYPNGYWKAVEEGFRKLPDEPLLAADVNVRFYKQDVHLIIFIRPPSLAERKPTSFSQQVAMSGGSPAVVGLSKWLASYIESLERAISKQKPASEITALDFGDTTTQVSSAQIKHEEVTEKINTPQDIAPGYRERDQAASAKKPIAKDKAKREMTELQLLEQERRVAEQEAQVARLLAKEAELAQLREQLAKVKQQAELDARLLAGAAAAEEARRERAALEVQLAAAKEQAKREDQLVAVQQTTKPTVAGPTLRVHAIVIGNSAYQGSARLDNPINDAQAMSAKLRQMGFKVTTIENATRSKLVSALVGFNRSASATDVSMFFYAGHAAQISGINYMLPTDINMNDLSEVPLHGISLNSVIDQYLPGKTKLVFLDACRDNPLLQVASRSMTRGLAPISVSEGVMIAYATKDGSVAADGNGKNSPFTKALLQHIDGPDDISVVLRKVRAEVMQDTDGKQQPWDYNSLTGGSLILSAIRAK